MHILVVYSHPGAKSFNRDILATLTGEAQARGHTVTVRDLYAERFNPVLSDDDFAAFDRGKIPPDILSMQQAVGAAEVVAFIHPIW